MFSLANRRYTGAKTKLLDKIDSALLQSFDYRTHKNLSFFDVFGGTGVVSEYFGFSIWKGWMFRIIATLYSNAIYQQYFKAFW
ncbi:hypothetical protein OQH61_09280 [Helicobacter sp. MIT 21-1697]|uniref:hypothetical protein n=1 Tax=Helicobacter sp. MIT 21-1697 TaxID=2993733 RepID=UPI00224AA06C|nr:hypothetical protein [Helicobacter sp. MIT 21-1697]MCX2717923.1 hypothetical protein [Helicobacter sp. MIT 21-1697]